MAGDVIRDLEQAVFAKIQDDELVELTRQLVRIPSPSGREGRDISDAMHHWLAQQGIESGLQDVGNNRWNVFGRLRGAGEGPRLLLNGHLDTKPGDGMTIDPFGGEVRDGRIYGRGSCDMKGPVAAEMIALKAIKDSGVPFNGTLLFGSEVGEDGPGGWKIGELVDGPCACDYAIVGEPTKLDLHIGNRGFFQVSFKTTGLATHTGTAYRGINAIEKMSQVITALYALPCFHIVDPVWGRNPINVQAIRGGGVIQGSVADECIADFDIRLNPNLSPQQIRTAVDDLLADMRRKDPQLTVEYQLKQSGADSAIFLPSDHPFVTNVSQAMTDALGTAPALQGFPGGCAAQPIMRRGIPAVVVGPGDLEQAHSVDEWISIDQLLRGARVYAAIALRILGSRG